MSAASRDPHLANRGSGVVMAASVRVLVDIQPEGREPVVRPYQLWMWLNGVDDDKVMRGHFYGTNHYRGAVSMDGRVHEASAFEFQGHDALYREGGLCIDLDQDGECHEQREIFLDGDVVPSAEAPVRLELRYP